MNKEESKFKIKKIQDGLLRLISEEYYAYQLYLLGQMSVTKDDAGVIDELFEEIGKDELTDHMKELIEWCRSYGYDIPSGEAEFRKFAGSKASKQVKDLKKNKDAGYYIDEAIKSEECAIDSYKKVIELKEIPQFTDLQALLWHIYYDECEHMEKLKSAKIAYDANASLNMM